MFGKNRDQIGSENQEIWDGGGGGGCNSMFI